MGWGKFGGIGVCVYSLFVGWWMGNTIAIMISVHCPVCFDSLTTRNGSNSTAKLLDT